MGMGRLNASPVANDAFNLPLPGIPITKLQGVERNASVGGLAEAEPATCSFIVDLQ